MFSPTVRTFYCTDTPYILFDLIDYLQNRKPNASIFPSHGVLTSGLNHNRSPASLVYRILRATVTRSIRYPSTDLSVNEHPTPGTTFFFFKLTTLLPCVKIRRLSKLFGTVGVVTK